MSDSSKASAVTKAGLHRRNRHSARYDFPSLVRSSPELAAFLALNPTGDETIDFADPAAVKILNRALLKHHYGISKWDLPPGYLCPPIPGRADYIHHLADLLSAGDDAAIPKGPGVRVLDIGVGANCVYPIIGVTEYGWRFVGSDIDPVALDWAGKLVSSNRVLAGKIECRRQTSRSRIFEGIVKPGERFDLSMCNPPFHASPQDAAAGSLRKRRNLNEGKTPAAILNFGGKGNELWCEGGESAFVRRMIAASAAVSEACLWFTTLVSKRDNLPAIDRALRAVKATEVNVIELAHGQKKSRVVAWTFLSSERRDLWRANRAA